MLLRGSVLRDRFRPPGTEVGPGEVEAKMAEGSEPQAGFESERTK